MHRGQVDVKLDTKWTATTYPNKLDGELDNRKNTTWDIVQGNLATQGKTGSTCVNMNTYVSARNGYAGNKFWSQVLEQDAYLSDKTGDSSDTTTDSGDTSDTTSDEEKPAKSGCGSAIGSTLAITGIALAASALIIKKRKED